MKLTNSALKQYIKEILAEQKILTEQETFMTDPDRRRRSESKVFSSFPEQQKLTEGWKKYLERE